LNRYARKNVDPEPLMRYYLKDVLLRSLHHVSKSTADVTGSHTVSNIRGVTTNLSVVTGLLSTLCRGSAKVTYDLLRSDLPDALESALCSGDERCVLDIMRFLDLLIVLLFEGLISK
jgi:E3 ubiquitin-protein ligase HECTD1